MKHISTAIFLILLIPPQLSASDTNVQEDVDELYEIVARLNNRISGLEKQVEKLGDRANDSSNQQHTRKITTLNASSKAWHDPANWSRLKVGMSEGRVKQILGRPSQKKKDYRRVYLRYTGVNAEGISLTGNVKFVDDQIVSRLDISPPAW